jgi:DNA-binding transcriptional ArsR family regulator
VKPDRSPLDRVLHALSHPLRRQILRELAKGAGSASTLSHTIGTELGNVSYHLNQVLAKQCKVVELVDTVPRRGSV